MISLEIGYRTGSGNVMPMFVHGICMHRDEIPVVFGDNQCDLCNTDEIRCKGYNGGCPPHAPYFDNVKPSIDNVYAIVVEFDMANAITFSGWWKGVSAPGLYILVYADRLTMNYTQRALAHFENLGYYTLGVSNCPGCKPKDCAVTKGRKCSKPKERRFSVEATGVRCDVWHQELFEEALPWWFHTPKHIPDRMYRYAMVFADKPANVMDDILTDFVFSDKSYCDDVPDYSDDYAIHTLKIPDGRYDAGMEYYAYELPMEKMRAK